MGINSRKKYQREVENVHLIGGLDDYVNSLSNVQLAQYVLKAAKKYPTLNSADKLNSLSVKYGFSQVEEGLFFL